MDFVYLCCALNMFVLMALEYKKNSLCVDASCIGNPGLMEYRIFDISQNKMVWESEKFDE
ncbi:MAG: hypothetical protein WCG25_05805 [bacterium]